MNSLSFLARAKVNIGLKILRRREDGYHTISTLFQEMDFHDTIHISMESSAFSLTTNSPSIPTDETNICYKAWKTLKDTYPKVGGISIYIDKQIPVGSGLGGGSSNAAAVVKGLNKLYHIGLTKENLNKLAVKIGSDVPFFICGGTQVGDGVGEKLTPIQQKIRGTYLLVVPSFTISTSWAYGQVKNSLENKNQTTNFADLLEREPIPFKLFENEFEDVVIPAYPEIGDIKSRMIASGAVFASLSGSGSTVFGIFSDETLALEADRKFKPQYRTVLTHPV
ncbi:MAG: 4-(cytidine 5'-diphospho)-2-C-methyl-D-erythritol kinase [Candidatus Marinimicrobia bacterium]|jgi:4-diphosphocytidyl-2-C-methyl-D-erythritol kinase|nr:4-(cytidine 5'-diphospho)-2-C-methyl-D-erythritol kinase [Candidatus Neomarinimicrobiota bacterium]MBT3617378.1 4-(cytidine 5'-diphospho)-2-C-methyl-D-erythritol kinase [Candidatus Neomarinimicrobiota bacterium]MBT3829318.1 4-(cytidine 5'-diphospho)-2-C-methyl-D-erythritol kinase [Candidatus Neomarinimicrobiota bacterium]MBT3998276.1 4-(cytidine 5'-diphospho)-2-C-methyl-D-erythritol kinase [Candidatus Neomarinimicrobiota bacterium]MBT4281577.1 4-(cytidine 5'-diphospho)-2-C-methyl-D-erythrito